ncbi:phage tail protein [Fluviibacterium sp. DFM31]|uniref:Phage tail protein n=1 Tax=Meridianimarinicoccus marinus TaxID=3231483 RepID=A0ABV3L6Y6_9RHOB
MALTSLVMMGLGAFRFGVNQSSYQALRRVADYRWAHLDRAGRAPAAQFLGPGVQTITLDGVIYPHFKGGLRQVEGMRLAARAGQPMVLVDGLGWVLDQWVITRVDERKGVFLRDGAPRRIAFSVTLQSYGGDAWLPSI